jgi:hypothetical protein
VTRQKYAAQRGMDLSSGIPTMEEIEEHDSQKRRVRLSSSEGQETAISITTTNKDFVAISRVTIRKEISRDSFKLGKLTVGQRFTEMERVTGDDGLQYVRMEQGWVCTTTKKRNIPILLQQEESIPEELTADDCLVLRDAILHEFDSSQLHRQNTNEEELQDKRTLREFENNARALHAMTFRQNHTRLQKTSSLSRTIYVTLDNQTEYTLKRVGAGNKRSDGLQSGRWICPPPEDIFPGEVNVPFGSHSSSFMTGTEGGVRYVATRVKSLRGTAPESLKFNVVVSWNVSYVGANDFSCSADSPLSIRGEQNNDAHCRLKLYLTEVQWTRTETTVEGDESEPLSHATWQWKQILDTADDDERAWVMYAPAESEKIERACRGGFKSVSLAPFILDFEAMELRRAGQTAAAVSAARPVRRITIKKAETYSESLSAHRRQALPEAMVLRSQLLCYMEQHLMNVSQDAHHVYNPANFPPESNGESPYTLWKMAELKRLQESLEVLKQAPSFTGRLVISFGTGGRFLPTHGWKLAGKLSCRVKVMTTHESTGRTDCQPIDATGCVQFNGEQLWFLLDSEPHFIMIEVLFGDRDSGSKYGDSILLGTGGINPINPSKLWCPSPQFKEVNIDICCPDQRWRELGYDAEPTTTSVLGVQIQYECEKYIPCVDIEQFSMRGEHGAHSGGHYLDAEKHLCLCMRAVQLRSTQSHSYQLLSASHKWFWQAFAYYFNIRQIYPKLYLVRVLLEDFESSTDWFERLLEGLAQINEHIQKHSQWDTGDGMTIPEKELYDAIREHIAGVVRSGPPRGG